MYYHIKFLGYIFVDKEICVPLTEADSCAERVLFLSFRHVMSSALSAV